MFDSSGVLDKQSCSCLAILAQNSEIDFLFNLFGCEEFFCSSLSFPCRLTSLPLLHLNPLLQVAQKTYINIKSIIGVHPQDFGSWFGFKVVKTQFFWWFLTTAKPIFLVVKTGVPKLPCVVGFSGKNRVP